MKPNEVVGCISYLLMIAVFVLGFFIGFSVSWLLFVGAFGLIGYAFLSLWGLMTFNPWFKALREGGK